MAKVDPNFNQPLAKVPKPIVPPLPAIVTSPLTLSFSAGVVVPIPRFPVPKLNQASLLLVPGTWKKAEVEAVAPIFKALVIFLGERALPTLCQREAAMEVALIQERVPEALVARTWLAEPSAVS